MLKLLSEVHIGHSRVEITALERFGFDDFQMFKCPLFYEQFDSKNELSKHTNKNHTLTKEISCDHCPAKFLSLRCLRQHTIEEH